MSFILLSSGKNSTRRYNMVQSTDEIAIMLMGAYEAHLNKKENLDNDQTAHEYTSDMLHQFLDEELAELTCLVRQEDNPSLWIPYPKDWIKESCIFMYVRKIHEQQIKTKNKEPGIMLGQNPMEVD